MYKYNLSLIAHAQLSAAIEDDDLEMVLMPGQGAAYTQPPSIAMLSRSRSLGDLKNAEHVRLVERTSDTVTIERAVIGTAQDWPAGTLVLGYWSPEHMNQIYESLDMFEFLCNVYIGGGKQNVVIFQTGRDFEASASTGLNVAVTAGACFANYKFYAEVTPSALSFIAPVTSTRIDLIQANAVTRSLEVKSGTEGGSAPSADTDCCPLWEVTTLVGQTTRLIGDLEDVRPS